MQLVVGLVFPLVLAFIAQPMFAEESGAKPAPATFEDGEVLGSSNWQKAKDLLPEEILKHYQHDEYRNPYVELNKPGRLGMGMPPDFQDATKANRGRFKLSAEGAIVETTTGEQPRYIMGFPFPDISEQDPDVARKIVWNYFYNTWYVNADSHYLTEIVMLNRTGIERSIRTDVKMLGYDGNPDAKNRDNPQNLLQQISAVMVFPADLEGMVSLTWRYRDPKKQDSLWSYVPQQRRVRQVSPLNRSDGFMGSDLSIDDGAFFDGKPEDFTFRLLGQTDQLVFMDPFSVRNEVELIPVEGGGWRKLWKDVPRVGAEDPNWKGLPWAPVSAALTRRRVWVVEAKPKDPNYLYGRIVLRFDAETYHGSWASKYDKADQPTLSYQVVDGCFASPDGGKTYISGGGIVVQTSENLIYDRATASLFPPRNASNPADTRVPLHASEFSVDTLMQLGK
jgi:hypothetical protein